MKIPNNYEKNCSNHILVFHLKVVVDIVVTLVLIVVVVKTLFWLSPSFPLLLTVTTVTTTTTASKRMATPMNNPVVFRTMGIRDAANCGQDMSFPDSESSWSMIGTKSSFRGDIFFKKNKIDKNGWTKILLSWIFSFLFSHWFVNQKFGKVFNFFLVSFL